MAIKSERRSSRSESNPSKGAKRRRIGNTKSSDTSELTMDSAESVNETQTSKEVIPYHDSSSLQILISPEMMEGISYPLIPQWLQKIVDQMKLKIPRPFLDSAVKATLHQIDVISEAGDSLVVVVNGDSEVEEKKQECFEEYCQGRTSAKDWRSCFLKMAKQLHPDKPKGVKEEFVKLKNCNSLITGKEAHGQIIKDKKAVLNVLVLANLREILSNLSPRDLPQNVSTIIKILSGAINSVPRQLRLTDEETRLTRSSEGTPSSSTQSKSNTTSTEKGSSGSDSLNALSAQSSSSTQSTTKKISFHNLFERVSHDFKRWGTGVATDFKNLWENISPKKR